MDEQTPPPSDPSPEIPAPPGAARRGPLIAAIAVAVVVLGGAAAAFFVFRGSSEQLLDRFPAGSDVVATIYLDPAASQKMNLLRMADEIPVMGSASIRDRIDAAIADLLAETDLEEEDLDWVGSQVGVAVDLPEGEGGEPQITVLVSSDDDEAAAAALTRLRDRAPVSEDWREEEREGTTIWVGGTGTEPAAYAVLDGLVVLATGPDPVAGVAAVAAGDTEAVESSQAYQDTVEGLPEARLALVYVTPDALLRGIEEAQDQAVSGTPGVDQARQAVEALRGFAMTVSAEPDGLAVDVQAAFDPEALPADVRDALVSAPDHENPLLEAVPSDALAVYSLPGTPETFATALDQATAQIPGLDEVVGEDLIGSLTGDLAIAGMAGDGGPTPSGVLLLGIDDEEAMERAIQDVVSMLMPFVGEMEWSTEEHAGVEISTLRDGSGPAPFEFSYAVSEGAAILGSSSDAVAAAIDAQQGDDAVTSSEAYRDAVAALPEGAPSIYVDIDGIGDAVREVLPLQEQATYDDEFGPTIEHLDAFVVGWEGSEDTQRVRMFLRVP